MNKNDENKISVIIVAGGNGTRMGSIIPKQFLPLNGLPIIIHTIKKFENLENILEIVVVHSKEMKSYFKTEIVEKFEFEFEIKCVIGGQTRQQSVLNGLNSCSSNSEIVLIHDAVRPLVSKKVVLDVVKNISVGIGAIPVIPVNDTIKQIDSNKFIEKTLDRSKLVSVQTPQGFIKKELIEAYDLIMKEKIETTDDASVFEKIYKVKFVEGCKKNIKITTKEDLELAHLYIKQEM